MRRAIIAVLALAGCSSQAVLPIGLRQYMVIDAGKQVFARANETCAKLGRTMMPLGVPPEETRIDLGKQFKFECILAYEIVPADKNCYKMWVPTSELLFTGACEGCVRVPDWATVDTQVEHRANEYCAKTNTTMVLVALGFDMGTGLRVTFRCPP